MVTLDPILARLDADIAVAWADWLEAAAALTAQPDGEYFGSPAYARRVAAETAHEAAFQARQAAR